MEKTIYGYSIGNRGVGCSGSADVLFGLGLSDADGDVGAPRDVRVIWHIHILLGAGLRKSAASKMLALLHFRFHFNYS